MKENIAMHISLPEDTREQAVAAGFADAEQYVYSLVQRDRERLAIQAGVDAWKEDRIEDFHQFDRAFRQRNGLAS
jgi:acetoin utilization deacetylase AcuC-like enzyme